jgi:hypothetical protein
MRVRLTDGTREVELTAHGWLGARRLAYMAAVLLDRMSDQPAGSDRSDRDTDVPFGFSLDSSNERAEPYDDGRGAEYDDESEQQ